MLTLDSTLTDRSQVAGAVKPAPASLNAAERAQLRALIGQPALPLSEPLLDPLVHRWMPLGVPLLAVLLAASILLIWAAVL